MTNKSVMTFISVNKISVCLSVVLLMISVYSWFLLFILVSYKSNVKHCEYETFTQCWINAGPPSATLAQHWTNIGQTFNVFRYGAMCLPCSMLIWLLTQKLDTVIPLLLFVSPHSAYTPVSLDIIRKRQPICVFTRPEGWQRKRIWFSVYSTTLNTQVWFVEIYQSN